MEAFNNGGQVPAYGNEKSPQQLIEELREQLQTEKERTYILNKEVEHLKAELAKFQKLYSEAYMKGNEYMALWEESKEEVEQLRSWKAQALACTPDWQAIGKALNLRLGTSVSDQVLPAILSLLKDKREVVLQLRRLQSYCLHYVKAYEKTQRCQEVEQTLNKYDHTVIPES